MDCVVPNARVASTHGEPEDESVTKLNFLKLLDEIEPSKNLADNEFEQVLHQLTGDIEIYLKKDVGCLPIVINVIKDSKTPRYRRGVLLKALDVILVNRTNILSQILSDPTIESCLDWKDASSFLVSLPDLFANADPNRELCPNFELNSYYRHLLRTLYDSISLSITELQRWLYIQILCRIALLGHSNLLWTEVLYKVLNEKNEETKAILVHILTTPLQESISNEMKSCFDLYIEHLYVPIFHHMTPSENSGQLILSLLGNHILKNESFEYLICNKMLLQSGYNFQRSRQYRVLFNIFAYLVALDLESHTECSRTITSQDCDRPKTSESPETCKQEDKQPRAKQNERETNPYRFLFIETLLEITKSWSSRTKILFRSHEHNRYISCAIIVAMRYLSGSKEMTYHHGNYQQLIRYISSTNKNKSKNLREHVGRLQSSLMQGFPIYLNRSYMSERQLAICVGEVALEQLHAIVIDLDQRTSVSGDSAGGDGGGGGGGGGNDQDKPASAPKLEFGIQLDADGLDMKRLYDIDLECLFSDCSASQQHQPTAGSRTNTTTESGDPAARSVSQRHDDLAAVATVATGGERKAGVARDVEDEEGTDSDEFCHDTQASGQSGCFTSVPLYLSDCMNGLSENNNPRYVRLCLAKAGELIEKLSRQNTKLATSSRPETTRHEANHDARSSSAQLSSSLSLSSKMMNNSDSYGLFPSKQSQNDDAIRDIAIEFAQILLHLEDQFCLEGFYEKRINLMSLLCTAAPDLAIKYLLDEFNGNNVSIRHQLDILQALVKSAKLLSSGYMAASAMEARNSAGANRAALGGRNPFVKHVSLYFYGLVHRLKADASASLSISTPSAMLSMTKAPSGGGGGGGPRLAQTTDERTMMKRVIGGLASSASRIRGLDDNFAAIRLAESRASGLLDSTGTTTNSKRTGTMVVEVEDLEMERNHDTEASARIKTKTNTTTLAGKRRRDVEQQLDDEKEEKEADSSYLLSRIFLSLSLILGCVNQQPIACKLSEDLLDIMAAYKSHPDAGVRHSISACLMAIRNCTPAVYLEEHLAPSVIYPSGVFTR